MESLFESLKILYPLSTNFDILPPSQLFPPRGTINLVEEEQIGILVPQEPATNHYDATLVQNKRLTSAAWYQDVRHLTFHFDKQLE